MGFRAKYSGASDAPQKFPLGFVCGWGSWRYLGAWFGVAMAPAVPPSTAGDVDAGAGLEAEERRLQEAVSVCLSQGPWQATAVGVGLGVALALAAPRVGLGAWARGHRPWLGLGILGTAVDYSLAFMGCVDEMRELNDFQLQHWDKPRSTGAPR